MGWKKVIAVWQVLLWRKSIHLCMPVATPAVCCNVWSIRFSFKNSFLGVWSWSKKGAWINIDHISCTNSLSQFFPVKPLTQRDFLGAIRMCFISEWPINAHSIWIPLSVGVGSKKRIRFNSMPPLFKGLLLLLLLSYICVTGRILTNTISEQ